jgi:hypothetical protein
MTEELVVKYRTFHFPYTESYERYELYNASKNRYKVQYLPSGRIGHVIIATMPTDASKTTFKLGVAFCSPKDNFSRKKGKELALARMNCKRNGVVFGRGSYPTVVEAVKSIILAESKRKNIYWMKKVTEQDIR